MVIDFVCGKPPMFSIYKLLTLYNCRWSRLMIGRYDDPEVENKQSLFIYFLHTDPSLLYTNLTTATPLQLDLLWNGT